MSLRLEAAERKHNGLLQMAVKALNPTEREDCPACRLSDMTDAGKSPIVVSTPPLY